MNIGEASKASKLSAKMIRYCEQIGLIPPANRIESGYRVYTQDDVHRLHFIRQACDSWVLGGQDQRPPSDTYRAVHFLIPQGKLQVTAMLYQKLALMPT